MGGWGEPKGSTEKGNIIMESVCHLIPGDWVQGDGLTYSPRIKFEVRNVSFVEECWYALPKSSLEGHNGFKTSGLIRLSSAPKDLVPYSERSHVEVWEIDIQRQRSWPDFHPEDFCHRCGNRNIVWWTDSDRFNLALGHYAIDPEWQGIICVSCFVELHEKATELSTCWKLEPGMFHHISDKESDD